MGRQPVNAPRDEKSDDCGTGEYSDDPADVATRCKYVLDLRWNDRHRSLGWNGRRGRHVQPGPALSAPQLQEADRNGRPPGDAGRYRVTERCWPGNIARAQYLGLRGGMHTVGSSSMIPVSSLLPEFQCRRRSLIGDQITDEIQVRAIRRQDRPHLLMNELTVGPRCFGSLPREHTRPAIRLLLLTYRPFRCGR